MEEDDIFECHRGGTVPAQQVSGLGAQDPEGQAERWLAPDDPFDG